MLGLIDGLRGEGVDLGEADVIIGTSAGARTGAQVATGVLREVVEMNRRSEAPQVQVPADLDQFVAASMRIFAAVPDPLEAERQVANLDPLGPGLVPEAERRRVLGVHLPVQSWPEQPLRITVVDADSGRRVVFGSGSGVGLLDAVTASSALPGIYPLATIGGRRYADGGVHSLYNADLAAGHDAVVVVSPIPLSEFLQAQLDSELATLGVARVGRIVADQQSLAAIGPNPLSADATHAAVEAGAAQAGREIDALGSLWGSGQD
jgi:NTE family protein